MHRHLCRIALNKYLQKPKPFSAFCAHPWTFLEPILQKTCDSLVQCCPTFLCTRALMPMEVRAPPHYYYYY
jgi:hypothetical protein